MSRETAALTPIVTELVARGFDDASSAASPGIRDLLDASGVSFSDVHAYRDDAGNVTRFEFTLRAGAFDRFSYVYDPGAPLPEELPGELEYWRIDADWYFVWEDWN